MSIESRGGEGIPGGGPLQPQDIKPDDCTLALLACITKNPNDIEVLRRLERRETVREDGIPALGCIACCAQISLPDTGEPRHTGFCKAPFAAEARRIVAPGYQATLDQLDRLTNGLVSKKKGAD